MTLLRSAVFKGPKHQVPCNYIMMRPVPRTEVSLLLAINTIDQGVLKATKTAAVSGNK